MLKTTKIPALLLLLCLCLSPAVTNAQPQSNALTAPGQKLIVGVLHDPSLMEKPDWAFLLRRYGLEENFEAIRSSDTIKRKTGKHQ